jgi:hypothetical protein
MTRAVFNVATGPYVRGQKRLAEALKKFGGFGEHFISWADQLPPNSPPHTARSRNEKHPHVSGSYVPPDIWYEANPYAFKAYALQSAYTHRARPTTLLWCDASIVPIAPLEPLWERIERDGYWFSDNGWSNAQWTADSAYPALFPACFMPGCSECWDEARAANAKIKHVVATAFGISLDHDKGRDFLAQYIRMADAGAFKGPWWNSNRMENVGKAGAAPCGPPTTLGHRHDQTAASVIAWRLEMKLTAPPDVFAYRGGEKENTILVADGGY